MPPSATKTNLRSYEAQARLLRAVVAAHPGVSWNFKEIAECYGSDMTDAALNHRFRPLRASNLIIKLGREQGFDMKDLPLEDLPKAKNQVETDDIAKYFGASTPGGIEFHFRSVKGDAKKMKEAADKGGDPASIAPFTTPSKKSKASTPASTGSGQKRGRRPVAANKSEDSDSVEEVVNYDDLDDISPSKRLKMEQDDDHLSISHERLSPVKSGQKPVPVRKTAVDARQRARAVLGMTSSEDEGAQKPPRTPLPTRPRTAGVTAAKDASDPFCDTMFQLKHEGNDN